jgi:predicted kinase
MARRPKLWMLVGVPGSGKSTWIQAQLDHEDAHEGLYVASTDAIIESAAILAGKTYNDVFKDIIKIAEKQMYQGVARAVEHNHDIIWDQTNLTRKSRAKKLIMIPDHYEKMGLWFPTPDEAELQSRLASRPGKTIPENVMRSMIEMMEIPKLDEGFDTVMEITEDLYYV